MSRTPRRVLVAVAVACVGVGLAMAAGSAGGKTRVPPTTTTTTTTTPTPGVVVVVVTVVVPVVVVVSPTPAAPVLANTRQSHRVWRVGRKLATFSRARRPPVGTTFSFGLNVPARATFAFRRRVGRRTRPAGSLSFAAHPGIDTLSFQGRLSHTNTLRPGRYTVMITATNEVGTSKPASLSFRITA